MSDRTWQDWFKTICTAYIWMPLTDLKIGSSNKTRYTVLCQDLIAQYRDAAKTLSTDEWIKTVRATYQSEAASLTRMESLNLKPHSWKPN